MGEQMTIFDLEQTRKTCRDCDNWRRVWGYDNHWVCFQGVIVRSDDPDREACDDFTPREL